MHSQRHDELIAGLLLGDLTETERREVARILESCSECARDLSRFQRVKAELENYLDVASLSEPTGESEVPRFELQLPFTFAGSQRSVDREIRILESLLTGSFLALERCPLGASAAGESREVVAIVGTPPERDDIIRIAKEYLQTRRADEERMSDAAVASGSFLRHQEGSYVIDVVIRPPTDDVTLDLNRLDELVIEAEEE